MKVIDTHCDALLKLQLAKRGAVYGRQPLNFQDAEEIDTNLTRLKKGNVHVQVFAIFIEPDVPSDEKWQHALEQVDLFYSEIIAKNPEVRHVKDWSDLDQLKFGEIGAILSLEGADAIGDDLVKLRTLYRLGVRLLGLTWNNANLCADGAEEPRGGGLTLLGKEVVKLNNEYQVFTDVSHATVNGFWDILELADYPIATHSNARALCDHPRNLYDEQIRSLIENNGLIHIVFNPPFINENSEEATIQDVVKHIDHVVKLGGEKNIGLGSDFDGITEYVTNLENSSKYQHLIEALLKDYSEDTVRGFAYRNFLNHLPGHM